MPSQPSDSTSMDQVRELLMGTHLKDLESRIQRQEERLLREIADVREGLKTRTDSLENFMKSEASAIMHRLQEESAERGSALKSEQRERTNSIKTEQRERAESMTKDRKEAAEELARLSKDLDAREEALERKLTALSGTLDRAEQELRQLMLAENARLSEKVEEKYRDALSILSNTAEQVRSDSVSRSSLSSLLGEVVMKLSGPWSAEIPEEKESTPDAQTETDS
jgi:Septin family protein